MDGKHYKLRILPLFEEDLNEIVDYISIRLQNPIAAEGGTAFAGNSRPGGLFASHR